MFIPVEFRGGGKRPRFIACPTTGKKLRLIDEAEKDRILTERMDEVSYTVQKNSRAAAVLAIDLAPHSLAMFFRAVLCASHNMRLLVALAYSTANPQQPEAGW